MPGAALQTFKGNKAVLAVLLVVGVVAAPLLIRDLSGPQNPTLGKAADLLGAGLYLASAAWLLSIRVWIHQHEVLYRSLFGTKEIRWDNVRFLYHKVKDYGQVGICHVCKLIGRDGIKIRFGNRIERAAAMSVWLVRLTYPLLFEDAVRLFHSGREVPFGSISISPGRGLRVRKRFSSREIPWKWVTKCCVIRGRLYVFPGREDFLRGPAVARIPNFHVLVGLLDSICGARAKTDAGEAIITSVWHFPAGYEAYEVPKTTQKGAQ